VRLSLMPLGDLMCSILLKSLFFPGMGSNPGSLYHRLFSSTTPLSHSALPPCVRNCLRLEQNGADLTNAQSFKVSQVAFGQIDSLQRFSTFHRSKVLNAKNPWNPYKREMLCPLDLLIKIGCLVKNENIVSVSKAADLNYLLRGGQLY